MKKLLGLAVILMMTPLFLNAQILNPVHWSYSKQKVGEGQYIIHMKAAIDPGWHVYAQDAGEGPIPTSFTFKKNDDLVFKGKVRAVGKKLKSFDKNFNSVLKYFENSVDFVQYVQAKPGAGAVEGTLEYMVCDNKQCLPPKDIDFKINL